MPLRRLCLLSLILVLRPLAAFAEPNCNEPPISIEQLEKLATASGSQQAFLDAIPKDTMQVFTFVTNSLSIQRGEEGKGMVSPMWPRVIRSTSDGKITMSFVCDPKNPAFGKVEVLFFDDKKNELKAMELSFLENGKPTLPEHRVQKAPQSCVRCHSAGAAQGKLELQHVWPEYFTWGDCQRNRGITVYGSSDDFIDGSLRKRIHSTRNKYPKNCTDELDEKAVQEAAKDFTQFRDLQKDNPCFTSLPWPENPDKTYSYLTDQYDENITRRPNLILTQKFSVLTAQANFRRMKSDPYLYENLKYALAMDALGCSFSEVDQKLIGNFLKVKNFKLPNKKSGTENDSFQKEFNQTLDLPIFSLFAKKNKLRDRNWNLNLNSSNDAIYQGGNFTIQDYTALLIFKDFTDKDPLLKTKFERLKKFLLEQEKSCFNPIGISQFNGIASENSCAKLSEEHQKQLKSTLFAENRCDFCGQKTIDSLSKPITTAAEQVKAILKKLDPLSVARGKKLAQNPHTGQCITCHGQNAKGPDALPPKFQFIPNPNVQNAELKAELKKVKTVLRNLVKDETLSESLTDVLIVNPSMPPPPKSHKEKHYKLKLRDREDIKAYIESLAQ